MDQTWVEVASARVWALAKGSEPNTSGPIDHHQHLQQAFAATEHASRMAASLPRGSPLHHVFKMRALHGEIEYAAHQAAIENPSPANTRRAMAHTAYRGALKAWTHRVASSHGQAQRKEAGWRPDMPASHLSRAQRQMVDRQHRNYVRSVDAPGGY